MFPSPTEIKFGCSCPDWAGMCKHVAVMLYGIGARLDESPELFFKMRNVEMGNLICEAVSDHKEKLLARASRKSSRIIEGADLVSHFRHRAGGVFCRRPLSLTGRRSIGFAGQR